VHHADYSASRSTGATKRRIRGWPDVARNLAAGALTPARAWSGDT
jgi:hypothetical protein